MKSSPTAGGSGSSTQSKRALLHLTGAGVRKYSARRKRPNICIETTEESLREKEKWQAFFDCARDVVTDMEAVRVLLVSALEEELSRKEAKENSHTDFSEYPGYDVKGLMAQIYQDIHNIAAAQAFKTGCEKASTGRIFIGEVGDTDELLQKASVEVSSAISMFFAIPI